MTAFEIVYFQCVASTLFTFCSLLWRGIYILELEAPLRLSVLLRGFLHFGCLVTFLLGLQNLGSGSLGLIVQLSAMWYATRDMKKRIESLIERENNRLVITAYGSLPDSH